MSFTTCIGMKPELCEATRLEVPDTAESSLAMMTNKSYYLR